jgi:molybdate transport system ATP-binding protein
MSLDIDLKLLRSNGFSLDVSLSIAGRGLTALYGHSGSGKTTLLRCIAGLESKKSIKHLNLSLDNQCWDNEHTTIPTHQRRIGYVFQDPNLLPHLTVQGNLNYAAKRNRSGKRDSMDSIIEWLSLRPLLDKSPQELSGGEKQRVAIGRALATGPQLVLMDEPLSSLDQHSRTRILPFLNRLHAELEIPIVYVSHSLEEITYLADTMILLDKGQVAAMGSIFDLTSRVDLNMSHDEAAGSVLVCDVSSHDDTYGLSELEFGGGRLHVARREEPVGSRIRVRIPARDVSIALSADGQSSILNILEAQIAKIEDTQAPRVLISLNVGESLLLARITRKSRHLLKLEPGQTVYAQIKSVALLTEQLTQ